eukprot:CAMPEP_0185014636 /NCGR_PEP_ID=MMETSP1098-20130426/99419_1 /TAXON_ID=89044 /ORGANISM="Spumella elongata, Strain CCAP 955/1" /LENGTH=66 /DNA_ID=CAMNT_0027543731 /DNA_START=1145 /DNA_END=1345 /DNA_ORIENTATION=+
MAVKRSRRIASSVLIARSVEAVLFLGIKESVGLGVIAKSSVGVGEEGVGFAGDFVDSPVRTIVSGT